MQTTINVLIIIATAIVSLLFGYRFGKKSGIHEGIKRTVLTMTVVSPEMSMQIIDKMRSFSPTQNQ